MLARECISMPASGFLGGTKSLGCQRKPKHDEVTCFSHTRTDLPLIRSKDYGSSLEVDYWRQAGDNERNKGCRGGWDEMK